METIELPPRIVVVAWPDDNASTEKVLAGSALHAQEVAVRASGGFRDHAAHRAHEVCPCFDKFGALLPLHFSETTR